MYRPVACFFSGNHTAVHEAISVVSDNLCTYDNVEAVSHYCKFDVLQRRGVVQSGIL